jgi:hypothetical protein
MSDFEFAFSLFGLILGLALAEALGGLVRAIDTRGKLRIGWLTPMMSLVVALDIISFWGLIWGFRTAVEVNYLSLAVGGLLASTYYVASALSFPRDPGDWRDLDDFFLGRRAAVFGIVLVLNIVFTILTSIVRGVPPNWLSVGQLVGNAQMLLMLAAIFVPRRAASPIMAALLLAYLLGPLVIFLVKR